MAGRIDRVFADERAKAKVDDAQRGRKKTRVERVWGTEMRHATLLVVLAAALVVAGWSAGLAQARVADFYATVDAPAGEIRAMCSRGCDWPATPGESSAVIVYRCERQPCRLMFDGRGRVTLGQPK